jgi:hypothetical protein
VLGHRLLLKRDQPAMPGAREHLASFQQD